MGLGQTIGEPRCRHTKTRQRGTWYASFYYEDWTGRSKENETQEAFPPSGRLWVRRTFLQQQTADLEMTFESATWLSMADMKGRIKENTWGRKSISSTKLVRTSASGRCATLLRRSSLAE